MVRELALFEREPLTSVEATEEDFRRDCFGANRRCEVLIGEADGRVQGFIMFYYNYSTWVGRAGLHVEDFFVREAARGLGLGKRLLAAVAKIAVQRNCRRLDLAVLEWNPARKLWEMEGISTSRGAWQAGTMWSDGSDRVLIEWYGTMLVRFRYFAITKDKFLWRADATFDRGKTWIRDYWTMEAHRISR